MTQPELATRNFAATAGPLAAAAAPMPLPVEQALDRLRGRLMRQSFSQLLNQAHGVRQGLPHLAALETALEEHGPSVLAGISRPVLVKLCSQLSGLPLPADDPPLQDLLERLMRALETAPVSAATVAAPPQRAVHMHDLSDFLTDDKLMVAEASYTDFAAAADELATTRRGTI